MAKQRDDDEPIEPLDNEERIKRVLRRMIELVAAGFFGEINLVFRGGVIVSIDERRTRKPEEL